MFAKTLARSNSSSYGNSEKRCDHVKNDHIAQGAKFQMHIGVASEKTKKRQLKIPREIIPRNCGEFFDLCRNTFMGTAVILLRHYLRQLAQILYGIRILSYQAAAKANHEEVA